MGELDAGLVTLADLRETAARPAGGIETVGTAEWDLTRSPVLWSLDVESRPSDHRGLSLVSLTVTVWTGGDEDPALVAGGAGGAGDGPAAFTLRQLVRLRGADAEEYLDDDLVR